MPIAALPSSLSALLDAHGATHSPRFPPRAHSDHGPMAYLALHALGADPEQIELFARRYRRRLTLLVAPRETLARDTWHERTGHPDAYPELQRYFAEEIGKNGVEATLARYLPSLASGWVRDLFHPMIRLAYGIEFGVPGEVAAGLAFLASAGDDPRLALAARLAPARLGAAGYLANLRAGARAGYVEELGSFNQRYRRAVDCSVLRPLATATRDAFAELSRTCLEVFDRTHDFFALHLVTGSHAFRICAPWIGPHAEGLFGVGLGAAYVALGAPPFSPLERPAGARLNTSALTRASDEHDVKLAHSCLGLARWDSDPTYERVAERYLTPRTTTAACAGAAASARRDA